MSFGPSFGLCVSFFGASLLLTPEVRAADTAPAGTLDEIVITAQKRTETVQSVPVSVTVIPSEELAREGVQTIVDLSRLSAAIEFTAPATSPGGGAFVRGIGTETLGGVTATPSVAVVLDGVVLGNTNVTDIFDISRVEVLKGPQGTLFGGSVSAGIISVTTNAPDPSAMSATVNAEYGSGDLGSQYQRRSLRATANLPISADSALRLSFHADDNLGVFNDVYENRKSDQPSEGVRLRYLWKPSDTFTVNFSADYNSTHESGVPVLTFRSLPSTTPPNPVTEAVAACGVTPSSSNFDFCSQYYNVYQTRDRGASLQFDWDLGPATLTSITSYRLGSVGSRGDIEAIPLALSTQYMTFPACHFSNCVPLLEILPGGINGLQTQERKQYSEEIRLASAPGKTLDWVAGLFFQHYHLVDNQPGELIACFPGPPGSCGATIPTPLDEVATTQDYAAFGNLTYHITDSLRLIGGARVTHSSVEETQFEPSLTGNNNTYGISATATRVSWRAGVQDDLTKHTMVYATVSTGYKAPEIADTPSNPNNPCSYPGALQSNACMYAVKPEVPISYELGIKQSVLDDRLAIDADIFYEHVVNYQGQNCIEPQSLGTPVCTAGNVPYVNTKGLELDIFGRPLPGLTVNLSGIYNPATYPPGYLAADGSSLAGHQLNYASKEKVTLSAEQTVPLSADYSMVIGVDDTYRSAQSVYASGLPQFVAPSNSIYGARLGLSSSKNWSVYLFGRNLGASAFPRQIYPIPFAAGGLWQVLDANSKRLVGLQLQAKF